MSRVILPGSYDPVTLGHLEIIKRASQSYDEVFVVAFENESKEYAFTPKERVEMLALATSGLHNVRTDYSDGLVIDYMKANKIEKIIKGYRNDSDYEYELVQAKWNKQNGGYDTELIMCDSEFQCVSSTLARQKLKKGESLQGILPKIIIEYIKNIDKTT